MKKRTLFVCMLAAATAALIGGCGSKSENPPARALPETAAVTAQEKPEETGVKETVTGASKAKETTAEQEAGELIASGDGYPSGALVMLDGPGMAMNLDDYADHFAFERVYDTEHAAEKGILTCYNRNDKVLWTYETEAYPTTELDQVEALGEVYNGYLLAAGGSIYNICTIGVFEGQEDWVNEDFGGASASVLIDDSDVLNTKIYLSGYYGPDLMEIDLLGNTVAKYDELDFSDTGYDAGEFYWPYSLTFEEDGCIGILFDSTGKIAVVDPETGKVKTVKDME